MRLAIIAQEVLSHNMSDFTCKLSLPSLPQMHHLNICAGYTGKFSWTIMDPAVGCFVACMPTWSPLLKPVAKFPHWISSICTRVSHSISCSQRSAVIGDEDNVFYLQDYNKGGVRTDVEARRVESKESQIYMLPSSDNIIVRTDLSQHHYRIRDDETLARNGK